MARNNQKQPNFLIVGAAKSGTTSLSKYLRDHPDVFIPERKELWYLQLCKNPNQEILNRINTLPRSIESYLSYFEKAPENVLKGEATPSYLLYPDYTIQTIKEHFVDYSKTKIIIILREPFDKILSLYRFNLKIRTEYLSLQEALDAEVSRRMSNTESIGFNYLESCYYFKQVKKFKEAFDDVLVLLYDDLKKDSRDTIKQTCSFLEIDPTPILASNNVNMVYNKSNYVKSDKSIDFLNISLYSDFFKYLPYSVNKPNFRKKQIAYFTWLNSDFSEIRENTKMKMKKEMYDEIGALQDLINRDLTKWLIKYE